MSAIDNGTSANQVLVFAHLGDLHITEAKERNYTDFLSIVAQLETECKNGLDFVVLPGDNADNGKSSQYALIATALKMLSVPVHIITGDHDMEPGDLTPFYRGLAAEQLPKALTVRGYRCLFLDICGPGSGGPDFQLGTDQLAWLQTELTGAKQRGETSLIFTHTYPDDLKGVGETTALNQLIAAHDVALVDMGHTHYNELANDGQTIFAATRSTGQIEEGPVGYSIATLDNGIVSWRFKPLDEGCPFVVITAPADHRLIRKPDHVVTGSVNVRAVILGRRPLARVTCQIEGGEWTPMSLAADGKVWTGRLTIPTDRLVTIIVQAVDESGRPGQHSIKVATSSYTAPQRFTNGSDAASIGAWPENGIYGTQLGPNRNGKPTS